MNKIFCNFQKIIRKPLNIFPKFNFVLKVRPTEVKTHRDEFKPFTINNLWDNPG
jgi:hypothetical protein